MMLRSLKENDNSNQNPFVIFSVSFQITFQIFMYNLNILKFLDKILVQDTSYFVRNSTLVVQIKDLNEF